MTALERDDENDKVERNGERERVATISSKVVV